MAFVKLDTGILRSTIWFDKEARDVFLTALLMAEPMEMEQPTPQLNARDLEETGWVVPPGWYGFVPASGIGIVNLAQVERESGMAALERLGEPEPDSRSQDFDGRRLVRIDGGYLVLNFMRYREKDHTAALRMRRLRERKKADRDAVTASRYAVTGRTVTDSREQSTESRGRTEGRKEEPTPLPADVQGEKLLHESRVAKERRFYALIQRLSELQPEKDPPDIAREVTSYQAKDGRQVKGIVRPEGMSEERLDRSLEDAEWWIEELTKPKEVPRGA